MAPPSDIRLRAFAALFALGVVAHEFEFALEQEVIGPLGVYLDNWRRAVPTVEWSSHTGLALHAATIVLAVIAALARRPRVPLSMMAVTFALSQAASPDRITSHASMMAAGLLVVLALTLLQGSSRLVRGTEGPSDSDWDAWTLRGLAGVAALTYFFAFFYKLNPIWFSSSGSAPQFTIHPATVVLNVVGAARLAYQPVLAAVAIYGAIALELVLPVLLLGSRTRLLGCLVGLLFHIPMVAEGVTDFPALIVAFYPAFLSQGELRALLAKCARPSIGTVAATVVASTFGVLIVRDAPKLRSLARASAVAGSQISLVNAGVTIATLALFIYLAFVLGLWLWQRRTAGGADWYAPGDKGASFGQLFLRSGSATPKAALLLIWLAFALDNLSPFLGLPAAGSLVMYSGISTEFNNHWIMPRLYLHDSFTWVEVLDFDARGTRSREARDFTAFVRYLHAQDPAPQLHLNVLRYHMSRICGADPNAVVRLTVRANDSTETTADVCQQPSMLRYSVVPGASRCTGDGCTAFFRRWTRRGLHEDWATSEENTP